MENSHKCLEERRDNFREGRTAFHTTPTSNTFRGTNLMGRHNSLSGNDHRFTAHLVAAHQLGQKENCSKNVYAEFPPEQK